MHINDYRAVTEVNFTDEEGLVVTATRPPSPWGWLAALAALGVVLL